MRIISENMLTKTTPVLKVSIVVAVYNEQAVLKQFHTRLCSVLNALAHIESEIIYINDGSDDNSWQTLNCLRSEKSSIQLIDLSRNFGKEAAMTAGLDYANGDAVVLLDADLQDPPELLPKMISAWLQGFDVVNMRRTNRDGESFIKKTTSHYYYRLLAFMSDVHIEKDVGDFRLLSRAVVLEIRKLKERNRYMKGLMAWPGFKQTTLTFERPKRAAGETKWNFIQLIGLGFAGITSFSVKPLKIAMWLGVSISLTAFFYSAYLLIETLIFGNQVQGYPSLMLVQLWLGGVQLLAVGVLGEYIGRIYNESKGRPIYIVKHQTFLHSKPNSSHLANEKDYVNQ